MILLSSAAFACPDLAAEVERATTALVGGDLATTQAALDAGTASFACAAASTGDIARYWLVAGALKRVQGDEAGAAPLLAAARNLAARDFDERLGPDLHDAWTTARADGTGTLAVEPADPALVDGEVIRKWPSGVTASPHVVQVAGAEGAILLGRAITLEPGEDALVTTGLAPGQAVVPTAPPKDIRRKSPALLIVSGVAVAGAGACAGLALAQKPALTAAESQDDLDAAFGLQKVFAYSTWGLAGVAGLSLGVHLILP
jgi:hypothetical protein